MTLAILLPLRAARDPARFRADTRTPPALTATVATAVLGTRLTLLGWTWAGIVMLVVALVLWGGALGICTLAAAKIAAGARALGIGGVRGGALEDIAIGLWVLTMLWLLVLLFAEARWPRLSVGPARWSTVFPLGMYAVCSFAVGVLAHAGAITSFARVWVWIGLASWAIVFAATIGRAVKVVRGQLTGALPG